MILNSYYQDSKYKFEKGIRYYLDTPLGQVKMFVKRSDNTLVLQFFPKKELVKVFGKKNDN